MEIRLISLLGGMLELVRFLTQSLFLTLKSGFSIKSSTVAVVRKQTCRFNKLIFKTTGQLNSIVAGSL